MTETPTDASIPTVDLDRLEAAAVAASKGVCEDWLRSTVRHIARNGDGYCATHDDGSSWGGHDCETWGYDPNEGVLDDRDFLALASPENVLALIALLRYYEGEIEELTQNASDLLKKSLDRGAAIISVKSEIARYREMREPLHPASERVADDFEAALTRYEEKSSERPSRP